MSRSRWKRNGDARLRPRHELARTGRGQRRLPLAGIASGDLAVDHRRDKPRERSEVQVDPGQHADGLDGPRIVADAFAEHL